MTWGRGVKCHLCGGPIAFVRLAASPTQRGGKMMPINPDPDPEGRVAVRHPDRLVGRVLAKDEHHDEHAERLYMTHFATCGGTAANLGDAAESFLRSIAGKETT